MEIISWNLLLMSKDNNPHSDSQRYRFHASFSRRTDSSAEFPWILLLLIFAEIYQMGSAQL